MITKRQVRTYVWNRVTGLKLKLNPNVRLELTNCYVKLHQTYLRKYQIINVSICRKCWMSKSSKNQRLTFDIKLLQAKLQDELE